MVRLRVVQSFVIFIPFGVGQDTVSNFRPIANTFVGSNRSGQFGQSNGGHSNNRDFPCGQLTGLSISSKTNKE
jgi:hypothetical protein